MDAQWGTADRAIFNAAAAAFVEMVGRVGKDAWDLPGLGVWTVRSLVGHTSRSLSTIETYLGKPSAGNQLDGTVAYYRAALGFRSDPDAIAQRGRDAGEAMGADPLSYVAQLADRVTALVHASSDGEPVGTPLGTMTLGTYLPTRIFELAVHTLDLGRALDLEPPPSLGPAVSLACELVGELAAQSPEAVTFLLALTGRTDLPAGFSLV